MMMTKKPGPSRPLDARAILLAAMAALFLDIHQAFMRITAVASANMYSTIGRWLRGLLHVPASC
jgi:hypothetical protein